MTRDGPKQSPKQRRSHKKAHQTRSLPVLERQTRETPYQDYNLIKKIIQSKTDLKRELTASDLFVDSAFPPDRSSLTYVYSGDDKYERTVFQRAKEIKDQAVLSGVGGICNEPFPWNSWKQRGWLQAALVVVSLHVRALERLIPGFRRSEQNFDTAYTGCFHFNLWRFGEWVDIVVDDYLPMLDNEPLFCRPLGSSSEMWGPLVEKAYAKCKKTFQAIEYGFTLDALTDLTGAICEFYTPDIDPPSNLFHIVYKSGLNRSFMTCWRNNKRLTPAGFNRTDEQTGPDTERYLHIITAVTKDFAVNISIFQLIVDILARLRSVVCHYFLSGRLTYPFSIIGGRMEQMIRLKCPFTAEPKWQGRFSDGDNTSWQNINSEFMSRLQPDSKKDPDEYWMTFSDFRCNFGGLFILNSVEPYRLDGLNMQRTYRTQFDPELLHTEAWADVEYHNKGRRSTSPYEAFPRDVFKRRTNSDSECHSNFYTDSLSAPCSPFNSEKGRMNSTDAAIRRKLYTSRRKENESPQNNCKEIKPSKDTGLHTGRSSRKGDALPHQRYEVSSEELQQQNQENVHNNEGASSISSIEDSHSCLPSPRRRKSTGEKLKDHSHSYDPASSEAHGHSGASSSHLLKKTHRATFIKKHSLDTALHGLSFSPYYSGSIDTASDLVSAVNDSPVWATPVSSEASRSGTPVSSLPIHSALEETDRQSSMTCNPPTRPSTAGTCQASLSFDVHQKVNSEGSRRPRSAPDKYSVNRRTSPSGSLNSLTQSFFLATKADYFRSEGRWKIILEHKDVWSGDMPSSDRTRLDIHTKNQRIYFLVTRDEQRDPFLPPTLQEKRHVLISLLQDYRQGALTANSLLVPIGFCLYKTKHSERDERRHISKFQLIGQIDGQPDKREVTARFDLESGGYFLVPYYQAEQHHGEYLLKVLIESDLEPVKAGCKLS